VVHADAAVLVRLLGSVHLPVAPQDVYARLDVHGSSLLD
jgi:hypothetical protein